MTYRTLLDTTVTMIDRLVRGGISAGDVCSLEADFSPTAIAAMLALTELGVIQLPITSTSSMNRDFLEEVGEVEKRVVIDDSDRITLSKTERSAEHVLYSKLQRGKLSGAGSVLVRKYGGTKGSCTRSQPAPHEVSFASACL